MKTARTASQQGRNKKQRTGKPKTVIEKQKLYTTPTIAYATAYPLTTLLRILSAQVLAILLFR